jgi:hypothetical protein
MRSWRFKLVPAWAGIIALIPLVAYREIETGVIRLRIAFADDQTDIIEQMREKAERAGPAEAADCLSYVMDYYPSATKQVTGSPLDRVVERARRNAVREMIARFRTRTRHEFGDDPRSWVNGLKGLKAW